MVALINGLSSVGRGSWSLFPLPGSPGAKASGSSTFLGWQGHSAAFWSTPSQHFKLALRTLLTSCSRASLQWNSRFSSCHSSSFVLWAVLYAHHKHTRLLTSWFSSLEVIRDKCHCPAQIKTPLWQLAAWNTVQDGGCVNVWDACQPLHSSPLP